MRTKYITMGILAHVDAGKTTLSEAVLYLAGAIRKIGRVDHKNAFLDTDEIERERGITVFSKEARFETGGKEFTLLDTPGHTDFSSETERTLQVLDYAVLVVSGADGVQAHTVTLWKLFRHYGIPVFVFVNKMDRPCAERQDIIRELSEQLGGGVFADFDGRNAEEIAGASEVLMEEYLETGTFCEESIRLAIEKRELFPVFFGSALKLEGVEEFIEALGRFTVGKECGEEFGARVYKIGRDKQGNRLTYLKVTSGTLRNKMLVDGGEKIEQIRLYNGGVSNQMHIDKDGKITFNGMVTQSADRSKSGVTVTALNYDTKNMNVHAAVTDNKTGNTVVVDRNSSGIGIRSQDERGQTKFGVTIGRDGVNIRGKSGKTVNVGKVLKMIKGFVR